MRPTRFELATFGLKGHNGCWSRVHRRGQQSLIGSRLRAIGDRDRQLACAKGTVKGTEIPA